MFGNWINKFSANPRQLFLLDGLGALLSTSLYILIVVFLIDHFGIPKKPLYWFIGLAVMYMIYSFTCYSLNLTNWRPFLRIIALANLFHCGLTVGMMIAYGDTITGLGIFYFVGEILIVTFIALLELKTASSNNHG